MPEVTSESVNSVVILRIRGADEAGVTLLDVLTTYAGALTAVGSKLVIVTDNARVIRQFHETGTVEALRPENIYLGTDIIGDTVRRAYSDAVEWVGATQGGRAS